MLKERADILCVKQGLFESREKAKRAIMAGIVYNDCNRIDKPGEKISLESELRIKGKQLKYVSRGGLKLEKAIKELGFDVKDKTMLDIGASTGGFTDCALQNGAKYVYALDVGTNQLAWKIRVNPNVKVMEKTNFRYCKKSDFEKNIERVTIDVSFISLSLILPTLAEIVEKNAEICALIKPQFEAGKDKVGKGGIVRSKTVHIEILEKIYYLATGLGFEMLELTYSPITGGEGNIEYLTILKYIGTVNKNNTYDFESIVSKANINFS